MEQAFTKKAEITGRRKWYKDSYTDETAYNQICTAKAKMLLGYPFWGFMGLGLVLVETPHSEVPTLATDGYHIFYSAKFVNLLSVEECIFAVAHEIYHCVYGHTGGAVRRKHADWDADRWNRAADYVINLDLMDTGIGDSPIIDGNRYIGDIQICHNEKYRGMSSEEVYHSLTDDADSADNAGDMPLDTHIEVQISDGADGDGDGDADGGGGVTIVMTAEQFAEEQLRWQKMAQQAVANVQQTSQDAGSIPSHLLRLIGGIHKPKIHWTTALRKFVIRIRRSGYSFIRPDKRTFGGQFIIPGFRKDQSKLRIAVAFDTSGSVSTEALTKCVAELFGMMKSYNDYEIHAFCFEGSVDQSTYMKISSFDNSAEKNLTEYVTKIKGGGGTLFQSVWDFMRSERIKPNGLVLFTDGYPCDTVWHKEGRYTPTIFVTIDNTNGWKAPFGKTLVYEAK